MLAIYVTDGTAHSTWAACFCQNAEFQNALQNRHSILPLPAMGPVWYHYKVITLTTKCTSCHKMWCTSCQDILACTLCQVTHCFEVASTLDKISFFEPELAKQQG
jgi:hypothetical protein